MPSALSKPLSEKELDNLSDTLSNFAHEKAMSLEEVDGLFAAFHCSPEMTSFNDFLSVVWGDETGEEGPPFEDTKKLNQFINLLMRLWNDIGRRFQEEAFFPYFSLDEGTGEAKGNEWAKGFLRGSRIAGGFEEMMDDEDESGSFLAIFVLAHEHDEDPELKPFEEEITPEKREDLIVLLCAGVTRIYRYFVPHRKAIARNAREKNTIKHTSNKLGRNDPCHCGSGLKYKKCCLQSTIH
ncbi:MAG: UPF0149 family protein [Gammaproteobacteria bacterium]|nr:UPF0149 family protein [Gammaproteobacteria bacterium]